MKNEWTFCFCLKVQTVSTVHSMFSQASCKFSHVLLLYHYLLPKRIIQISALLSLFTFENEDSPFISFLRIWINDDNDGSDNHRLHLQSNALLRHNIIFSLMFCWIYHQKREKRLKSCVDKKCKSRITEADMIIKTESSFFHVQSTILCSVFMISPLPSLMMPM